MLIRRKRRVDVLNSNIVNVSHAENLLIFRDYERALLQSVHMLHLFCVEHGVETCELHIAKAYDQQTHDNVIKMLSQIFNSEQLSLDDIDLLRRCTCVMMQSLYSLKKFNYLLSLLQVVSKNSNTLDITTENAPVIGIDATILQLHVFSQMGQLGAADDLLNNMITQAQKEKPSDSLVFWIKMYILTLLEPQNALHISSQLIEKYQADLSESQTKELKDYVTYLLDKQQKQKKEQERRLAKQSQKNSSNPNSTDAVNSQKSMTVFQYILASIAKNKAKILATVILFVFLVMAVYGFTKSSIASILKTHVQQFYQDFTDYVFGPLKNYM